jgi:hypothetical protein
VSVFVAVIVGTSGAAFGPSGLWEVEAAAALEAFAGSVLVLLGTLGCEFHRDPALLDFTETEKAIAVAIAITAINNVADRFNLVEYVRERRVLRINPGRFSSRGIGNSF